MRTTVYHEPAGGLGGAELVSAALAAVFRASGPVTLAHHQPALTREALAAFTGEDLDGVELRYSPKPDRSWRAFDGPVWKAPAALRRWQAALSEGCDRFVASVHGVPPFNHAPHGGLYIHFPAFDRRVEWPWAGAAGNPARWAKRAVRRWLHDRLWRERFAGYQVKLANARFTADHVRSFWGVGCDVVYPPVRTSSPDVPKRSAIVVLGRFTPMKQQRELVREFRRVAGRLPGWELVCIGSVGPGESDLAYFAEVEAVAAGGAVRLLPGATSGDLRGELAAAKVFWHAAGFGVDAAAEPHRLEHFGIATVEAMAAGCVPLVPDRGGQPEIVRHGQDGFLCRSVAELGERAAELAADDARRATLAASARVRAAEFSRERFAAAVRAAFPM